MSMFGKFKVLLLILLSILGLTFINFGSYSSYLNDDNTTEQDINWDDEPCYYGCPNSKRIKRLVTKKR